MAEESRLLVKPYSKSRRELADTSVTQALPSLPGSPVSPEAEAMCSLVSEVSEAQLGSAPSSGWSTIQIEAGRAVAGSQVIPGHTQ